MTGVSIRLAGVTFTKPVASMILPSLDGLVGEFTFGGTAAASIINTAAPNAPAAVVGAPVFGAGFVTTTATSAYINLNVAHPPQDLTLIEVSRGGVGTLGAFGHHQFLGDRFTGFDRNENDATYLWNSDAGRNVNQQATMPNSTSTDFVFQAGVLPLGGEAKLFMSAGGALASSVAAANAISPRPVLPTFSISGAAAISRGGDTAYCAIYSRVLTDAEIASAYAGVRKYLTGRGIVIA